ncbi:hypothetical protein CVT26_007663 [Gymnopilus dilepis]|uniref:Uncharacterized protein n=1 Tax=Gymnopilus dilepis TaxID=231916 RepID=A0A409VZJ7_9AGAR|nr:hypothetical protein CVT26_007663 [Gymnopilus dilepis]
MCYQYRLEQLDWQSRSFKGHLNRAEQWGVRARTSFSSTPRGQRKTVFLHLLLVIQPVHSDTEPAGNPLAAAQRLLKRTANTSFVTVCLLLQAKPFILSGEEDFEGTSHHGFTQEAAM